MKSKTQILNELESYKNYSTRSDFARFLGVSLQVLNNWCRRNTFDETILFNAFPEVNKVWILTGEGEMLSAPKEEETQPKEQRLTSDDIRILLDNIQQREKHFDKLLSQYDVFLQQTSLLIRQHDALIEQQNKLIDFIIKK